MAKKKRVAFNRTEDLEAVDSELDTAMERLDDSNDRIGEILSRFEAERQPPEQEGVVPADHDGGRAEEPASEAGSAQAPVKEVDRPEKKE